MVFLLVRLIDLYIIVVFAAVILSWVRIFSSGNPVQRMVEALTEPVFSAARRIIPPIGGLDLSPIIVLIALNLLRSILVQTG